MSRRAISFFEAFRPGQKLGYLCTKNSLTMLVAGSRLRDAGNDAILARARYLLGLDAGYEAIQERRDKRNGMIMR